MCAGCVALVTRLELGHTPRLVWLCDCVRGGCLVGEGAGPGDRVSVAVDVAVYVGSITGILVDVAVPVTVAV